MCSTPVLLVEYFAKISLCNFGFELVAFDYSKIIGISSHCIHTKATSSLVYMQLQVHYEMFSCQVWSASHTDIHCISVHYCEIVTSS